MFVIPLSGNHSDIIPNQQDIVQTYSKNYVKMESDSGISVNLSHFDGGTVRRGGGGDAVTVAQVINGESEDNLLLYVNLKMDFMSETVI